ncbi:MAG: hypothetical protein JJU28_08210 [Cyclobacteriaceae bacterium]|nr:hypothetical protein [Cyclobacteriaceae bacterium]
MASYDFCPIHLSQLYPAKIKGVAKIDGTRWKKEEKKLISKRFQMPKMYFSNPVGLKKWLNAPETKAAAEDIANFSSPELILIQGCVN